MIPGLLPAFLSTLFVSARPTPTVVQPVRSVSEYMQTSPQENLIWVVKKGETITSIAKAYYGSEDFWTTLWDDNPSISDPNALSEGVVLNVRSRLPSHPDQLSDSLATRNIALIIPDSSLPSTPPTSSITPMPVQEVAAAVAVKPSNFDAVYQAAGAKYGVPWQILYGIHMTETGGRDGAIASHLGNGPEGPMQFMPGTFAAYAVDGNGDGVTDIDNAVDAIYTAANYLQKHGGWQSGLRAYGGNYNGTLALAEARGFTP